MHIHYMAVLSHGTAIRRTIILVRRLFCVDKWGEGGVES